MHALIECIHAKQFWMVAQQRFDLHLPRLHPQTWARDILLDLMFSQDARCKIISIMHTIWSSRNRWTHDRDGFDPVQAIKWVHETLSILDIPKGRKSQEVQGWKPPEAGWITINTDGSVFTDSSTGGADGVARSHLEFLGAWSKPLPGVSDPFVAELLALREGVIFAHLRGYSHVIMELIAWSLSTYEICAVILDQLQRLC